MSQKERLTEPSLSQKTRQFLTHNKIFFETVMASSLALMAVVVSAKQIQIAEKQTNLAALQTEIARQQLLPQFSIQAKQVMDKSKGKAMEDKIYVHNHGGVVQNLECENAVFLKISLFGAPQNRDMRIAVDRYYLATKYTGNVTGLMMVIEGDNNNYKVHQLGKDLNQILAESEKGGSVEVERYVRLKYRDALGDIHLKVYEVPLIYGAKFVPGLEGSDIFFEHKWPQRKVSEEKGIRYKWRYSKVIGRGDFDNITAKDILKLDEINAAQ